MRPSTSGGRNEPWNAIGPSDNGECGIDASMISLMKSMERALLRHWSERQWRARTDA